jgi:hypothetical protein
VAPRFTVECENVFVDIVTQNLHRTLAENEVDWDLDSAL